MNCGGTLAKCAARGDKVTMVTLASGNVGHKLYTKEEIAAIRCVEVVTIKTQIKGLLHKFGCSRTREIVQMIRELNISHLFLNE